MLVSDLACDWTTGRVHGGILCNHSPTDLDNFLGFMTFAPEWLSGSPNLNTSNALYL